MDPERAAGLKKILEAVNRGETGMLAEFWDWAGFDLPEGEENLILAWPPADDPVFNVLGLKQATDLETAAHLVREARTHGRSVLGNPSYSEDLYLELIQFAMDSDFRVPGLALETVEHVVAAAREADQLRELRAEVLDKLQTELRRGKANPGTRLAWGLLRAGAGTPGLEIDPDGFKFTSRRAEASMSLRGLEIAIKMGAADYDDKVRATVAGYNFSADWAVLLQKPLGWMVALAEDMRSAGVDPEAHPDWEAMEGPGGPIALTRGKRGAPRLAFFRKQLLDVDDIPPPADAGAMREEFMAAAAALHEGVMGDESIPRQLRQALNPILMGTYKPIDRRDYFDAAFCRRLVEADYLETFIKPMPEERARELAAYREALAKIEAGYDEFSASLDDGVKLVAMARPEAGLDAGDSDRARDMETGEVLPRYVWRVEGDDATMFFTNLPARTLYALSLGEKYPGRHPARPKGVPAVAEVWHPLAGKLASYANGDDRAHGDPDEWAAALTVDAGGRMDTSIGPFGWNFPLHVVQRDDQGDPALLATPGGVVPSPDFSAVANPDERLRAEDAWLDLAARVLATPGELGLIYHQFFRYCSDSPLPELPNLIGSHYGLSDTHQTVRQSLERRWVGRLIGDCDDLAEFFQVLTARQGKLSHVMQLPAHAAAGYVEKTDGDEYRFVVLQTGPVLQFTAPTLQAAVERAYRSFDDDGDKTHITAAAVPLLLRFADEETRTPFVLSARIYEDREYAEAMIRVQGYWHLHVFSAAVREMEEMLETDREVGSIKELGSLYERVGRYRDSDRLRREELDAVAGDIQATLSTLLDLAQLHLQDKNNPKALAALAEMEALFRAMEPGDAEYGRSASFRSYWAVLMSRLGEPARAWDLLKQDVQEARDRGGRISDATLRILVALYDKMSLLDYRNADKAPRAAGAEVREVIERAYRRGIFKSEDSYNNIINRYFVLGRFAVADAGRAEGLAKLLEDGPYPEGAKDHTRRGRGVSDEDWEWFRIIPALFLANGLEMLDRDDQPELYDPEGAKPILEAVSRAVEKGAGLGSDVAGGDDMVKSELALAFINGDLAAFNRIMTLVRDKDYASLYDDAAVMFGSYCGLIPLEEFPAWIEAYHRFFPGKQNYFKAVYRALDKEHFDHGAMLARATADFFADDPLLVEEAAYIEATVPARKERKEERDSGKEGVTEEGIAA